MNKQNDNKNSQDQFFEDDLAGTRERLSFTTFLAIVVHAAIIFGIGFSVSMPNLPPQINVTLATQPSQSAPEIADFMAQFNQEGSGTENEVKKVTTDRDADFNNNTVNDIAPPPQIKQQEGGNNDQRVLTAKNSNKSTDETETESEEERQEGNAEQTLMMYSPEIASLEAELAKARQEYANRPKVKRLTQVSAKASDDAQYLLSWSQQVERVGNANFPQEALSGKITGSLQLLCVIKPDGSLQQVTILSSSGHSLLDEAARQIIRLAAPFEPFPKSYEGLNKLEVIRTLHFEINGLTTEG